MREQFTILFKLIAMKWDWNIPKCSGILNSGLRGRQSMAEGILQSVPSIQFDLTKVDCSKHTSIASYFSVVVLFSRYIPLLKEHSLVLNNLFEAKKKKN